jgi:hypothetical protein
LRIFLYLVTLKKWQPYRAVRCDFEREPNNHLYKVCFILDQSTFLFIFSEDFHMMFGQNQPKLHIFLQKNDKMQKVSRKAIAYVILFVKM